MITPRIRKGNLATLLALFALPPFCVQVPVFGRRRTMISTFPTRGRLASAQPIPSRSCFVPLRFECPRSALADRPHDLGDLSLQLPDVAGRQEQQFPGHLLVHAAHRRVAYIIPPRPPKSSRNRLLPPASRPGLPGHRLQSAIDLISQSPQKSDSLVVGHK